MFMTQEVKVTRIQSEATLTVINCMHGIIMCNCMHGSKIVAMHTFCRGWFGGGGCPVMAFTKISFGVFSPHHMKVRKSVLYNCY